MIASNHLSGLIMLSKLRFLQSITFAALLACGSSPSISPNLSGNWEFDGDPNAPISDFGGYLQSSSGQISGTIMAWGLCASGSSGHRYRNRRCIWAPRANPPNSRRHGNDHFNSGLV